MSSSKKGKGTPSPSSSGGSPQRKGKKASPSHSGGSRKGKEPAAVSSQPYRQNRPIRVVRFTTDGANTKTYNSLIDECTDFVCDSKHLGLPVLCSKYEYFFIELRNKRNKVKLVARRSDFYIVAVLGNNIVWYFRDKEITLELMKFLFEGDEERRDYRYVRMSFESSYPDLEFEARKGRSKFDLGIGTMDHYISVLAKLETDDPGRNETVSRACLTFIQMISESARLRIFNGYLSEVAEPVEDGVYKTYTPDDYDTSSQNKWGQLSESTSAANSDDEEFDSTIELKWGPQLEKVENPEEIRKVKNVKGAKRVLRMLKSILKRN